MDVTGDRTEQLVRQTLDAVAKQVRSSDDASDDVQPDEQGVTSRATVTALRRTHRRKRRLVIIAACLVVLLVAGGVALLTQRSEPSPKVSGSPAAAQPPGSDTSPPYPVPADDDEITELLPTPTVFQQFYDGTYAGASAQLTVDIQVFPDALKQSVEYARGCASGTDTQVEVRAHEGCAVAIADAEGTVTKQDVYWVEDSNTVVGLESTTFSRDQLVELASSVQRDGARVSLDPVPDGLQPSGTHVDPNADRPASVSVDFTHDGCDYNVTREVSSSLPTGSGSVTINGSPGVVIGENAIAWVVRGSLMTLAVGTIHTAGDPFVPQPVGPQPVAPSCDVQATAATIRYITETEWNQLVGDHTSDATTTTTAPSTTTTTSASDSSQPQGDGDEAAIAKVFETWISGPGVDATVPLIEDGEALRGVIGGPSPAGSVGQTHTARVDSIRLVDDTHADVTFSILDQSGTAVLPNQQGHAVKIDGTWRVSRDTYCDLVAKGGIQCPPG